MTENSKSARKAERRRLILAAINAFAAYEIRHARAAEFPHYQRAARQAVWNDWDNEAKVSNSGSAVYFTIRDGDPKVTGTYIFPIGSYNPTKPLAVIRISSATVGDLEHRSRPMEPAHEWLRRAALRVHNPDEKRPEIEGVNMDHYKGTGNKVLTGAVEEFGLDASIPGAVSGDMDEYY